MASQIITLPRFLFSTLLSLQEELRLELWKQGLDIPWMAKRARPGSIPVSAQIEQHQLGNRLIFRDAVLALVIVPEGARPDMWPRPLPDARTLKLLEILEAVICASESLSAHQALQFAHAFNEARVLPAIGPEPVVLRQPQSARLRRLRAHGLALTRQFAERLAEIDRRLAPYAERMRTADLDQCIATLSAQAELGIRLRLRPGDGSSDSSLGLLTATRRNSLEDLMHVTANLAEATRSALERWAPHSPTYGGEPTVRDLEFLQPTVTGDAWNAKHRPWRREDAPDLGFGSSEQLRSPVPARFVFQSVEGWMREFQGPCWVGVHPLVWIAIAHVEFIRISPFLRGNRRTGRILFEALLYRSGWPVLPWQLGFERHRDDYLDALLASFTKRSYQPVAEFVLRLFEPVLAAGQRMLDILPTERARLEAAIAEEPFAGTSEREYAEALLGQVLVEGFGWGLENNRGLLKRLHAQGLVDVIRTPAGAVFSSSIARGLLRQNDAS
jgi:hypothetical protein